MADLMANIVRISLNNGCAFTTNWLITTTIFWEIGKLKKHNFSLRQLAENKSINLSITYIILIFGYTFFTILAR
jgi:hypothetical protein